MVQHRTSRRGPADWLSLAATPVFAGMALMTALPGDTMDAMCGSGHGAMASAATALGGMVPMYLLMSAFHLAPWLRLITARRDA